MTQITATEASRRFADLLDGVEHRGEHYTIVRRGRVVARLEPTNVPNGAAVKALLRRNRPDAAWSNDLAAIRADVHIEERR